jgi:hypothetical protein
MPLPVLPDNDEFVEIKAPNLKRFACGATRHCSISTMDLDGM